MRGVWRLLEYMKWKKGTDGAGGGGKEKKKENAQRRRAAVVEGEPRERPHFILPLWGGEKKKKENANERVLTLEGI